MPKQPTQLSHGRKPEGFKLKQFVADQALDELGRGEEGPATRMWKFWISRGGSAD